MSTAMDAPLPGAYWFRAVRAGECEICSVPYPMGAVMYLTADGIVHPDCHVVPAPVLIPVPSPPVLPDPTPPIGPPAVVVPIRRPRQRPKPKLRPQVVKPARAPHPEDAGTRVCRKCWTVHPATQDCP